MLTPTCVHVKFSSGPYILNGITFDLKAYPPYRCILTNYISERPREVGTYYALCRFRSYSTAGQCKCHPLLPFISLILLLVWTINTLYTSTKARFGGFWARLINHTLDSFEVSLICSGKLRDKLEGVIRPFSLKLVFVSTTIHHQNIRIILTKQVVVSLAQCLCLGFMVYMGPLSAIEL